MSRSVPTDRDRLAAVQLAHSRVRYSTKTYQKLLRHLTRHDYKKDTSVCVWIIVMLMAHWTSRSFPNSWPRLTGIDLNSLPANRPVVRGPISFRANLETDEE